jgi:radical SAM protein with 4Fe4S-binding SPASM domain
VICPDKKHIKKGFMSLKLFQKIILEIKDYAKTICLHLHGEPLLHNQIIAMIRFCKQNTDAKVSLSTNAVSLNKQLSKEIISSGLDEIVFSLDALDRKLYKKIKSFDYFDKVITNVKYFFSLKKTGKPHTVIKMVQTELNKNQISQFIKEWSIYDCKTHVSRLSSWSNQLETYSCLSTNSADFNSDERTPCADPWFKMIINHEGKVLLCCHDYKKTHVIGDLLKDDICDIWNSTYLLDIRQAHLNSNLDNTICKSCLEWSTEQDEYLHFEEFSLLPIGRP